MSSLDEYKKQQQELMKARRIKTTIPTSELERQDDSAVKIVPRTFKEKWINYWYHYKLVTLAAVAGAALVFSFVWSVTHATKYDASISVVTSFPFETIGESLHRELDPFLEDGNGDGKANLLLAYYALPDPDNPVTQSDAQAQMAQQMKLVAQLSLGEDFLFLVDDLGYEKLHGQYELAFEDLSAYSDSDRVEGDKYRLNGTKLLADIGLGDWEDPLYLCLSDFSAYDERTQTKKDLIQLHDTSLSMLKALMAAG